jgi:hypothetical protein
VKFFKDPDAVQMEECSTELTNFEMELNCRLAQFLGKKLIELRKHTEEMECKCLEGCESSGSCNGEYKMTVFWDFSLCSLVQIG